MKTNKKNNTQGQEIVQKIKNRIEGIHNREEFNHRRLSSFGFPNPMKVSVPSATSIARKLGVLKNRTRIDKGVKGLTGIL